MGRISQYLCPSCGESWEVQLGHGLRHGMLENVLEELPAEIRRQILTDTKEEQIPSFEFQYLPAICGQCRKVVSVPVIYLHRTERRYAAGCADCGNTVTILEEGAEPVCPYCGESVLSEKETGRWD